jgi:ATP-binding cassette subfamily G (WHITE) protein 2 (SNQ2)
MLDRLLLVCFCGLAVTLLIADLQLETGGKTVYHGPIGRDSEILRSYFSRNGATCPSDANPAEYMLEAIGAGVTPRIGPRDWHDIWLDSPEHQVLLREIEDLKVQGLAKTEVDLSVNATC